MLTRRKFLRTAAAALGGLVAAACGPTPVPTPVPPTPTPQVIVKEVPKEVTKVVEKPVTQVVEKPVTQVVQVPVTPTPGPKLVVWGPQHFITAQNNFWTDSNRITALENGFKVDVQLFPWGEYTQKQIAAIEAKTTPDLCLGVDVPRYHAMGILQDVSDVFKEVGATGGGFYEGNTTAVTVGGKQYGVPFHNEPQFLYVRLDLFKEAGLTFPMKTLEEFRTAAIKLTAPDKKIWGFGNSFGNCPDGNNALLIFMWAFGGGIQDKNGNCILNTKPNVDAFKFYCDLFTKDKVMPPGVTGWDDTGNNKAWLAKQVAMIINTGSIVYAMRTDDKELLNNTGLQALPAGPGGPAAFTGGSTYGIFIHSKYAQQAKILIKGAMSKERYPQNLASAGGMFFPVLKDYANDPFYTKDRWNNDISAVLPYAYMINYPGEPAPWLGEITTTFLLSQTTSKIAVEGVDPQKALDDLQKQALAIQAKYKR